MMTGSAMVFSSSAARAAMVLLSSGNAALPSRKGCKTKGLDGNETFARVNGFSGTPVMVRPSDGAVLQGYRRADEIRRFLGLDQSKGGR